MSGAGFFLCPLVLKHPYFALLFTLVATVAWRPKGANHFKGETLLWLSYCGDYVENLAVGPRLPHVLLLPLSSWEPPVQ